MTSESDTAPLNESKEPAPKQFATRFPEALLERIDARAKDVGLSRNAWMEKAIDWVLTYLPTGLAHPERDRVATDAPEEVTGSRRLPPAPHVHRWTTVKETGEHLCPDCGEVRQPALKREDF